MDFNLDGVVANSLDDHITVLSDADRIWVNSPVTCIGRWNNGTWEVFADDPGLDFKDAILDHGVNDHGRTFFAAALLEHHNFTLPEDRQEGTPS